MNPLPYLQALVAALAALAAAVCGVLFALSFVAWCMCDPLARIGPFRPRPWLFLAAFTVLSALTYTLLP